MAAVRSAELQPAVLTVTATRSWCRGLSRSAVPPSGHTLPAANTTTRIGAVTAVPLSRRAPLKDPPAALALEGRELQPRA